MRNLQDNLQDSPLLVPRVLAVGDASGDASGDSGEGQAIVVDVGVYSAVPDPVKSSGVTSSLQGISADPASFVAAFSEVLLLANLTLPTGFGVGTASTIHYPLSTILSISIQCYRYFCADGIPRRCAHSGADASGDSGGGADGLAGGGGGGGGSGSGGCYDVDCTHS
jgi:hypothetical protein